jgi:DNA-binding NarL/FixJ family response regulator
VNENLPIIRVAIAESQPLTAEGVRSVLTAHTEFDLVLQTTTVDELRLLAGRTRPDVAILDKSGVQQLPLWIQESAGQTATVVWGHTMSEPEALRLVQAGVRGVLRKTATAETLLACLRAVSSGQAWMEEGVVTALADSRYPRSELTPRERQVMELVEHGLKNRDIARELGIRPGTVKIHLKHIFEKTGVRGRYGLALSSLRDRGVIPNPAPNTLSATAGVTGRSN